MSSSRIHYSRSELLRLRHHNLPISRSQHRSLWYFRLLQENFPTGVTKQLRNGQHRTDQTPDLAVSGESTECLRLVKLRKPQQPQSAAPSILLFNSRSLFNKLDDLKIRVISCQPDIICITETWLDESVNDNAILLPGYSLIRQDRDSRGGGVLLYHKSALSVSVLSNVPIPNVKSNILSCNLTDFDTCLTIVYHPYWGKVSAHEIVLGFLQSILNDANLSHHVIVGDINDLRLFIDDFFTLNDLHQIISRPTRGLNILDIVASNMPSKFQTPSHLNPLGRSDHKGVLVKPVKSSPVTTTKVTVRSFSSSSYAKCCEVLASIDWHSWCAHVSQVDIDTMVDSFTFSLSHLYQTYFPEKTVRMRSSDPPWITPSLKAISDARDKALSRGQNGKYICLREKFLSELSKSKAKYFARFSASASNSKSWASINSQINNNNKTTSSIDEKLAHSLNDKFQSSFSTADIHLFSDSRTNVTPNPDFSNVTESLIYNLIMKSKSNSSGPDGIPGFFCENFCCIFGHPTCIHLQTLLAIGCFSAHLEIR